MNYGTFSFTAPERGRKSAVNPSLTISQYLFVPNVDLRGMDVVDDFLSANGDGLNPAQFSAIRSSFEKNCISDYDSVKERVFTMFQRDFFYEELDRNRLKCYCRICNTSYTADKNKFAEHVERHFNNNHSCIVRVRLFYLCYWVV